MRSKREYVISKEQGDAVRKQIAGSNGSVFLNIPNLGATINSADISEIIDDTEIVAQNDNLLPVGKWSKADQKKRDEIIKKTRVQLEAKGVL